MLKIEITMEKRIYVSKEVEVSEEQLEALRLGENIFFDEMEKNIANGSEEWDYTVCDEDGNTIVEWG